MFNGNTRKKERDYKTEEIFEVIMIENFCKLMSETKLQIQEAQNTLNKINAKKQNTLPHYSQLKKIQDKEKNLPSSQRKVTTSHISEDKHYILLFHRNHGSKERIE